MAIKVEVSLKIPRVKSPARDEHGFPIDNGSIRFRKLIEVPSIPQPGSPLAVTTSSDKVLGCTVTQSEWHEEKSIFVLFCSYANRSIPRDEYEALINDPEWEMKPLLQA
jgi:hypothetical protein